MSPTDFSLSQLFAQAEGTRAELDLLDPRGDSFKQKVLSTIADLEQCQKLVDELSIFSPNEEIEDLSTQSLRYLTINYILAELLLRSYGTDRLSMLQKSSELLESFLARLDLYGILSRKDRTLYERFQEDRKNFSVISSTNPEDRREFKVTRFQEEKELKQKLEYLRGQTQSLNADDETVRSLYLADIAFQVNQTFHSLDMITQERAILAQMLQREPAASPSNNGNDSRSPNRAGGYSERLDQSASAPGLGRRGGPLLSSSGKPLQPFTLLDKRTQLQQGVFRPSHNLPTMSIDEYLEEEKRRGGIIDGGGNANAPQPELDEDNIDQVDAATIKAREWDEFVEANPKGAGNTLNRG